MAASTYVAQYVPLDSAFHRLDPRAKLLFSALMMVFVFWCHSWSGLGLLFLVTAGVVALSQLPLYLIGAGLYSFRYILFLTVLVQLLVYPDVPDILALGPVNLGFRSVNAAAMIGARLILILTVAQMLMLATSTLQLTVALETLFRPLKVFRFPIDELVMIITIAMHFLPLLLLEAEEVRTAQIARGADFQQGSLKERMHKQLMIIVPVFGLSLQRANDLAISLESRAYVPGIARTHLHPLRLSAEDLLLLLLLAAIGAVIGFFHYEGAIFMKRIKLVLDYDGTAYHGFQWQENAHTVQAEVEAAILKVSGEKLRIDAAGRTDAGVHALGQVVAFLTGSSVPAENWSLALNTHLPADINVQQSEEVLPDFHPRYDAHKKTYIYRIYTGNEGLGVKRRYAWCLPYELNPETMREACEQLRGQHDFRGFCSAKSEAHNFTRKVFQSRLENDGEWFTYIVTADGFLYNMVRIIVGALAAIGRGKLEPAVIEQILTERQRELAGQTAPPNGLFLKRVDY
jgi:tRNA pseudouridine38-40 synthase